MRTFIFCIIVVYARLLHPQSYTFAVRINRIMLQHSRSRRVAFTYMTWYWTYCAPFFSFFSVSFLIVFISLCAFFSLSLCWFIHSFVGLDVVGSIVDNDPFHVTFGIARIEWRNRTYGPRAHCKRLPIAFNFAALCSVVSTITTWRPFFCVRASRGHMTLLIGRAVRVCVRSCACVSSANFVIVHLFIGKFKLPMHRYLARTAECIMARASLCKYTPSQPVQVVCGRKVAHINGSATYKRPKLNMSTIWNV